VSRLNANNVGLAGLMGDIDVDLTCGAFDHDVLCIDRI